MKKSIPWINLITIVASLSILIAQAIGFRLQCRHALEQAVDEQKRLVGQCCGDFFRQQMQIPSDKGFCHPPLYRRNQQAAGDLHLGA